MIDAHTAKEGMALLSTAIGELMEDAAADAVIVRRSEPGAMALRAKRLIVVGGEVVLLANALCILARYGEGTTAGD